MMRNSITTVFLACVANSLFASESPSKADVYCGIRCVQAILTYFGEELSLKSLIEEARTTHANGQYSMQDLQSLLAMHGHSSYGFRFSSSCELGPVVPCILHYEPVDESDAGHFVVLTNVSGPLITIYDGLRGARQIRYDDPEIQLTRIALVVGNGDHVQGSMVDCLLAVSALFLWTLALLAWIVRVKSSNWKSAMCRCGLGRFCTFACGGWR